MEILIRPLHRRYAAEPPRRGSQVKGNKYSLPLGEKVLSECEANEGRSLLFYTFKFFDNEIAPHHRALRGASPQGEAYEMRLLNGLYQKTSYAP